MLEKYKEKLIATLEVLDNMPKNNAKNKREYLAKANETKKVITELKNQVLAEINKKYQHFMAIDRNPDLKTYEANIDYVRDKLYLLNSKDTAYEKSGLDKLLYNLDHFYKEDLLNINETIKEIIAKFKEVGVDLKKEDFSYSLYTYNYMSYFFEQSSSNYEDIKKLFENIYWKCPNIIKHIELNFEMLYRKYFKFFDNYFKEIKINFLQEVNLKDVEVVTKLKNLIKERDYLLSVDANTILTDFLNNTHDIKQYETEKIKALYEKFIEDKSLSIDMYKNYNNDLKKLKYSLIEYNYYLKYGFIIEDVKNIYNERNKYKNSSKPILKKIIKNENVIKKLTKKAFIYFQKYNDQKLDELTLILNNKITETSNFYDEYEKNIFFERVAGSLTDSSSIYDLLSLVISNYLYLTDCFKKAIEGISEAEIKVKIKELEDFLLSPYNTFIDNIKILEVVNLPMIISDHYKMFNISIPQDMINEDNLSTLINSLDSLLIYSNLDKSGLTIEDIIFVLEVRKNISINEEGKL